MPNGNLPSDCGPFLFEVLRWDPLSLEIHPRAAVRLDGLLLKEPREGINEKRTIGLEHDETLHIVFDFLVGFGSHMMVGKGDVPLT